MKILDVNVLVYAYRPDTEHHVPVRAWLKETLGSGRPFAIPDVVLSGFVRTVTRRPFTPVNTTAEAWQFLDAITRLPSCSLLHGSPLHFTAFHDLSLKMNAVGNLLTDVYVAAFALVSDGEIVSCDDDFARIPELNWRNPIDNQLRTNPR